MDSQIAILGANGTIKSTLLHLITGALQSCEGTISKHSALKLAKYSQRTADQLPYDQSPIEYFQSLFSLKYPEKDIMVCLLFLFLGSYSLICEVWHAQLGPFSLSRSSKQRL
jgi:ATPase subunit of ABC transporter with duplicated ATPase domains